MKILDKYAIKSFLGYLVWCFLSFSILFYVVDVIENIDKFIDRKAQILDILLYYSTYFPFILVLVSPIAVLLAGNFSCGAMSKHREIIALRSCGISSLRVAVPLLFFGFGWSLAMMFFAEAVVPRTNAIRMEIKDSKIDKKTARTMRVQGLLYQNDDGGVISIGSLDPRSGRGLDVLVVTFDTLENVEKLVRAREMLYENDSWRLVDGHIYDFSADSAGIYSRFAQSPIKLDVPPDELAKRRANPDEMGFFELKRFIARVRRAGGDPIRERTDLVMKVSYPFINLIILLFGVPIALRFRRSGMVLGVAQSVGIAFIYFAAIRVGQALGYNGTLSPFWASTMGNIVFGFAGFILLFTYKE